MEQQERREAPNKYGECPYFPYFPEVLTLIARGMTRIEVARILQIQEGTVAGYIKRLYAKLNVGSRAEAALEARRLGLI
jgi:DNA-binding CsgD family transcriptional regulator